MKHEVVPVVNQLKDWFKAPTVLTAIQQRIPTGLQLTPERLCMQSLSLLQTTPGLMDCSPTSILLGIMQAAEFGLELVGPLGQCYLVPRWDHKSRAKKATFQVGYRGYYRLMYRSGLVRAIHPYRVGKNDHFKIQLGTSPMIEHIPDMTFSEAVGYYVVIDLLDGAKDVEFMRRSEVLEVRDRYSESWKNERTRQYSPWLTNEDSMSLKTVMLRLAKRTPVSIAANLAAGVDEMNDMGKPTITVDDPRLAHVIGTEEETPAESKSEALATELKEEAKEPTSVAEPTFPPGYEPPTQ
jgi:phage RecT family recombinase